MTITSDTYNPVLMQYTSFQKTINYYKLSSKKIPGYASSQYTQTPREKACIKPFELQPAAEDFVFNLEREKVSANDTWNVNAVGCHGVESSWFTKGKCRERKLVADAMQGAAADFTVSAGDNFYMDGVKNPKSAHFNQYQADYGQGLKLMALGNHDYGFHAAGLLTSRFPFLSGIARAYHQVQHTYEIGMHKCAGWFMPFRYYAVTLPNAVFFILDSNTLPFDEEQVEWFKSTYDQYSGKKWKFIVMHHPIQQRGKRNKSKPDSQYYLPSSSAQVPTLWNELVYSVLVGAEKPIDFIICAHDHFLHVDKVNDFPGKPYQIITGGGGGELQDISQGSSLGAFKQHGFVNLAITANKVTINCMTIELGTNALLPPHSITVTKS
tara:strand:+ start:31513 stop:32655 length:1143 start_codon:yes stop_codon:yes gene_type:complete